MTMLTRQQSVAVFEFMREHFLQSDAANTPIYRALEYHGITDMLDLLSIPLSVVDRFKYIPVPAQGDPAEPPRPLSDGHKNLIMLLIKWSHTILQANAGIMLKEDEWKALEPADFGIYRLSTYSSNVAPASSATSAPQNSSGAASGISGPITVRPAASKVTEFRKSIKRDPASYPQLKDQKHWNSWNRSVLAQARTHDVSDVFDITYVPLATDLEAVELFDQKQSFVYSVLNNCLLTDIGKELVRLHEKDYNAQLIYSKLVDHATASTAAQLTIDKLVAYLTNTRLDSSWKGTSVGFLHHWHEQLRLLDEMLPFNERFQPNVKKRMLEAAVRQIPELLVVKSQDNNRVAAGGQPMDYDNYREVLMSAALERDDQLKLPASRSKHVVNNAESNWHGNDAAEVTYFEGGYIDSGDQYIGSDNFYSNDQQLSVYNQQFQQRRPFNGGNRNTNTRLPREIWQKLDENARNIIRGIDPNKPATPRKVNVHDFVEVEYAVPSPDVKLDEDGPSANMQDATTPDALESSANRDASDDNTALLAYITQQKPLPSGTDIRSILASAHLRQKNGVNAPVNTKGAPVASNFTSSASSGSEITVNGKRYVQADTHHVNYRIAESATEDSTKISSLIDRGANGGLAGQDVRLIETTLRMADVSGINNHTLQGLQIATVAGVVQSHLGPICVIMHQYAYHGKGKTIHSSVQIEHFGNEVNDRSSKLKGGKQSITTLDGYVIPLHIRGGLAYMDMHPPDDEELESLPHVFLTSDADWDPTVVDNEIDIEEWLDARMELDEIPAFNEYGDFKFDEQGYYRHGINFTSTHSYRDDEDTLNDDEFFDSRKDFDVYDDLEDFIDSIDGLYSVNRMSVSEKNPNFELLRPYFAFAPIETIKRTFAITTRWARSIEHRPFKKHFKSRFAASNVHRRREAVGTDTVYSDTAAIDNGSFSAQIYVGADTLVSDAVGMRSDTEFVGTLEDQIRKRGAMDKLISDRAQLETSKKVLDILRNYRIEDWQSEPYHEHQNIAERRYQTLKTTTNTVMDRTGAPAYTWLLAIMYVCYILNHTAHESLGWNTPLYCLTGITTDISSLLQFTFYEPVYYATADSLKYDGKTPFPSGIGEAKGRFVGFAESVGDVLTYKVLTDDTLKVIYRSYVRSALDESERNVRLDNKDKEESTKPIVEVIKSRTNAEGNPPKKALYFIEPDDIINRTYLTEPDEKGQRFRAKIVQKVQEHEEGLEQQPERMKFLVRVEGAKADEIIAYNDILNYLEEEMSDPAQKVWKFKEIIAHEGPLSPGDPSYKGSSYNVMIVWEDNSKSFEPLSVIAADSPVTCALYAKRAGLLDTPGWKRFKTIARREKKMLRMANQAKLASFRRAPTYQFGVQVPRTPQEAIRLDGENGNTLWQDSMALEMSQLQEYNTFKDLGRGAPPPDGHRKIRVHFVYAVKHDGRRKARLVADGHLTETPVESVYSGVVSLRSLRIVTFLAELNGLQLYAADVSNAYLEATTKEKVYIVGGIGFGDLEGHTLVIFKALYGLKSSGRRWHEKLYDTLRDMGFTPSKADSDVWMRNVNGLYEYIAVYVDDLAIASKSPKEIIDALTSDRYKLKLKGVGPIAYHLGCDFYRDPDGTLCVGPKRYIEKMLDAYSRMFNGEMPQQFSSPLEKNDHPELDDTKELDAEGITKYQSMIGALQWAISLGRFDIHTAVMSMGSFRVSPREGHLQRLKRIYGYLRKYKHGAIRIRVGTPDYSHLPDIEYNWMYSVYGDVKEQIPHDIPEPLGNPVVTTTYKDANLYHDMVTGRAVTGILHLLNGTPIDWFSKRQDTVETATYGSEFVAARIATDQIIDLRTTLRYLGVPIQGRAYLFGDNQSVITSSTIPHSSLSKRHNALSYHRVREAIVARILRFFKIDGKDNPADILSKHCGHPQMWPHVQPLLFWMGSPLPEKGEKEVVKNERIVI